MISILVPLDGSELAEEVLPCVEDLAIRLDAEVYFVQAVDARSEPTIAGMEPGIMARRAEGTTVEAERYLSGIADAWAAKGFDAKWEVLHGSPARSIATFARAKKSSMIAMSTHGRSGISWLVFGSVANQVLREAGVPVMLVRPTEGPIHETIRLEKPAEEAAPPRELQPVGMGSINFFEHHSG
jgi:nucleotide-binding universal stress UspA family protein